MAETTGRRAPSRLKQMAVSFFLLSYFTQTHTHTFIEVFDVFEKPLSRAIEDDMTSSLWYLQETGLTTDSRRLRPILSIMFSRQLFFGSHPPQRF